ncbi:hypothetical protein [Streptomyces apricus]|uniref:Uncharacterized protein n=1 Tax=Streptomyces apricus TaxID=1828112 RepID=A0A5B0AW88_9ACTN|nr:hypothetical protein [Streptomyces apricus]KAA0933686.1 hypothetical protein FGF04_19065 [Streptomyces apricus]
MLRHSGGRPPDPRRVRLLMLAGIVVLTVAVPLAVASAGPTDGRAPASAPVPVSARPSAEDDATGTTDGADSAGETGGIGRTGGTGGTGQGSSDGRAPGPSSFSASSPSPATLGVGLATAARCGPDLASPEGIEAQTCVLTQGRETWARTYYRNTTGDGLTSALTLMGPGGGTVRTHCAVDADDEPGTCETPRERTAGEVSAYTAVAEFAADADGPLLLRSGSNSLAPKGR